MKKIKFILLIGALTVSLAQGLPTQAAQRDNSVPPPNSEERGLDELLEKSEQPADEPTEDPAAPPAPEAEPDEPAPLEPAPEEPAPVDEPAAEQPSEEPAPEEMPDEQPVTEQPTVPPPVDPNDVLQPTAPVRAGAEPIGTPQGVGPDHGGPGIYGGEGFLPPHDWRRRPDCGHHSWWSECDDCCPPSCYVEGGVLFYQRHRSDEVRLVEDQNGGGTNGQRPTLLTTDDFDDDTEGVYLSLGHICDPCHRVELKYMGLLDFEDTITLRSTTTPFNLSLPFETQLDSNFDGFERLRTTYESDLHSIEANLFYTPCGCCLTPLVGFRYLRLDEHLGLTAIEGNGDVGRYIVDTDNDLVGFQIGALVERPLGKCWCWNVFGKAGGYCNFAHQETLVRAVNDTITYRDFGNGEEEFAFVGEIGINLVGHIAPRMAIIAGYSALWLDGVALAPEQLDFSNTPTSGSGLDHDGDLLYHGWNLGVRFYF